MIKKLICVLIVTLSCLYIVSCNTVKKDNSQNPKQYVGIYDGEAGGYLELKSDGGGTYKDKGAKAGNIKWFVDKYRLSVSADTLDYEISADVHSFNDMLYFLSNSKNWIPEKFHKR